VFWIGSLNTGFEQLRCCAWDRSWLWESHWIVGKKAGKVLAVEMDPVLAAQINMSQNLEICVGDALKMDFPRFNKVISNLPYSISSPVTFKLLGCKFDLVSWCINMSSQRGWSQYLAARIWKIIHYCPVYADVEILEVVPPSAFSTPRSKFCDREAYPAPSPYTVKDVNFSWDFWSLFFSEEENNKECNIE